MAKRFFFLSAGLFLLALAALVGFHVGSKSAAAQMGTPIPFAGVSNS